MSEVCDNHKWKPVKIYCKCIGCEIESLNQRIKEQEELLQWFRARSAIDPTEFTQGDSP
ncbi:hypothetical protein J19TS2_31110 [Cohnella xylanilytica]|uniref:hypothetical protein n=1 Tax=Cohnella xylanilytica TaxID=557555 RepID=UPI001B250497|nr:hypothetical protein [Cohnella xylanilytica]GIO13556.1 hypothetical protein J19TS2_31110 [Cohnella xylanilytica]